METTLVSEKPKATTTAKAQPLKVEDSPSFFPETVKPKNSFDTPVPVLSEQETEDAVSSQIAEPKIAEPEIAEAGIQPEILPLTNEDEEAQTENPVTSDTVVNSPSPAPAAVAATNNSDAGLPVEAAVEKAEENIVPEQAGDTNLVNQDAEAGNVENAEAAEEDKEPDPNALQFMDPATTEQAVQEKLEKTATLAKASATTKSAGTKINESIKAQNTPVAEAKATSGAAQVNQLAKKPVAPKSKEPGKKAFDAKLKAATPQTLDDLDKFKQNKQASTISKSLLQQVQGDVGSVKGSFGSIKNEPKPAPAPAGTPIPAAEPAKSVSKINLSGGILPAIQQEKLQTQEYLQQADSDIIKEGITQEQLAMVDSGELAEAAALKGEMATEAAAQPAAVNEAVTTEQTALSSSLNEAETATRTEMNTKRSQQLKQTGTQQTKAKSDLEKKREEVAKNINDRYTACQQSVTRKLDNLEQNSLRDFDAGQKRATAEFEEQVDRDIKAFKQRRYSSGLGGFKWVKDYLFGIDDFPEVKNAFKNAREVYVNKIDNLINSITKKNNEVIEGCKAEIATTQKEIDNYVKGLSPALQSIGKKAQNEVAAKLQELGKEVEERKEKLQQQLLEKRKAAMQAIDKKIAAMKKKMRGALATFGDLIADAARKFFKWALSLLGIDAEGFMATLQKAGEAIGLIFKDPGKFFSNLVAAVKGSIDDFKANFKEYLTGSLFDWLTGALGAVVTLPQKWDLKGIISVVLQLAGISWQFIRKQLVKVFGEEKVAYAEANLKEVKEVVQKFMTEGVAGLWDWIKDQAEMLMTTVVDGIKDWLLTRMVIGFAEWIAGLLIPGGAIVKLIQGIYKLVMFFVDNIQRIIRWVGAVLDSLGSIAAGAIPSAITFIVDAMKTIIPVILDFFAKLLNISGIVNAVQDIIAKVTAPIHKAIDKFVAWISKLMEKVLKRFKGGKQEKKADAKDEKASTDSKEKLDDIEVGKLVRFRAGGENHRLWVETKGNSVEIMLASEEMTIRQHLSKWKKAASKLPEEKQVKAQNLIPEAEKMYEDTLGDAKIASTLIVKLKKGDASVADEAKKKDNAVEKDEDALKNPLSELFNLFGEKLEDVLLVSPHPVKVPGASNRESHHVPQNEFKNTFINYYQELGNKIKENGIDDLGIKLTERAAIIDAKYPEGNGLSAISLHKNSHTAKVTGIHSKDMQKQIESNLKASTDSSMIILLKIASRPQLQAKVNKESFEQYVSVMFDIEGNTEKEIENSTLAAEDFINIYRTQNGLVIEIKATKKQNIASIVKKVENEYINKINILKENERDIIYQRNLIINKLETKIHDVAKSSFINILTNSIGAVKTVLHEEKNSNLNGPENLFENRLNDLRLLALKIWGDNIYNKLET
ncbi:hypothetical protein KJK34_03220 [Flavobacterium sp. D11R37]|uniref:hypothetical protein n=1 Tax=Flavobacterium coralii TaxID=2838017 RepID=UPI001CA6844C|nr:hypothetical protein [Flavobacterium coralii]MBY8961757.1 hypothetical protein [Flavobacterium coralii]